MAKTATLTRNGTSVDLDLIGEGRDLVLARDVGKPTSQTHTTGAENPRYQDYQNAQDTFVLTAFLVGSGAYSDAKTLAEDIIKPRLSSALTLDLSALPSRSTYSVVPAPNSACTLSYVPGTVNIVGVQLSLPVVDRVQGGTQTAAGSSSPASGSGVRLTRSDDGTSITLSRDLTLTRTVSRPSLELNPTNSELPIAIDQNEPAQDNWELSGDLVSSSANSDANTFEEDLIRPRLGDATIELEFLGNQWNLDKYTTAPTESRAIRTSLSAGQKGVMSVPTIQLQTVRSV